jgi:CubicO group peptidase (beta-lactamase class C family)
MTRRIATLLVLALGLWGQTGLDPSRVDLLAETQRSQRKVPGLAVAIIARDKEYVHGYGVRRLGSSDAVTPRTIFAVGSVTKSFTALGAALLVDEGKLAWDRPVREYLPWFRMYDEPASELMTVRDLLTHRSGLPRYDFMRFGLMLPRDELVRRLRYLPPTASFREKYQYQNLMYTAAGYLTGQLDGSSWEELTETRIFAPLGMRDSTVRVGDTQRRSDFASPHEQVGGQLKPIEFYDYQKFGVGPNGAVNTSAGDLVRYVRFHMGDGEFEGKRIISKASLDELHRQQMVISERESYALGWTVSWPDGTKLVSHGGAIAGFRSWVGFVPERQEAVIVLVNSSANPDAIGMALAKEILGWKPPPSPPRDPSPTKTSPVLPEGPPSRPLSAYAGRYRHPAFGASDVELRGDRLTVRFPAATLPLRHVRFDIFTSIDDPSDGMSYGGVDAQFVMNQRGEFDELQLKLEPAAPPIVFRRMP